MQKGIEGLIRQFKEVHEHFASLAVKQVNTAMTLRNWLFGYYIVEYQQHGSDRAQYGEKVLEVLSHSARNLGLKGISETNLKLFRQFYLAYPQISQTLSDQFKLENMQAKQPTNPPEASTLAMDPLQLVNNLSFSHFIELMQAESPLKRIFYEIQAIKNNWGVRELKRAMNTLLFERTGLSTNKTAVLSKATGRENLLAEDMIRHPYILEFLGLAEKAHYTENDLEEAIINHLQEFLIEAGHGFCFEARQKRITFDNTHYRIDLVFYHRLLHCHVLIDLKLGEFTHADAGQMNLYLNYYKDKEMTTGDSDPVGIILCAHKNDALVKYATGGLPQKVFVSKYLVNLPTEEKLRQIVLEEQEKLSSEERNKNTQK
jgi:predicted nuclease of restriction endonuclease-like (RecB) superfamily